MKKFMLVSCFLLSCDVQLKKGVAINVDDDQEVTAHIEIKKARTKEIYPIFYPLPLPYYVKEKSTLAEKPEPVSEDSNAKTP